MGILQKKKKNFGIRGGCIPLLSCIILYLDMEKEKVAALRGGSHKAFEDVFLAYFQRMCLFIGRVIKSDADAEELAQEVFVKLWRNREAPEVEKPLGVYLYTIARESLYPAGACLRLPMQPIGHKPVSIVRRTPLIFDILTFDFRQFYPNKQRLETSIKPLDQNYT